MSKSFRVSAEFHEYVSAHKRDDETMEETLRRLIGGPEPSDVAGILSEDTADAIETDLDEKRERNVEGKRDVRGEFE